MSNEKKGNFKYDDPIYNEKVKEQFLSEQSEESRNVYKRLFKRSARLEELFEIDLYDFNIKQIRDLLFHLYPKTIGASRTNKTTVSQYLDWAIIRGYRSTNINPLHYQDESWILQFIDESAILYYSKDEIDDIVSKCKNYPDKALITLLFEGASGTELSEIRNLKPRDIDFEKCYLRLHDGNNERGIFVTRECIEILKATIAETQYYKKNGELSPNSKNRNAATELIDNGYVFKRAKTRTQNYDTPVGAHMLYNRLRNLAVVLNTEPLKKYVSIKRSGMIYMGKKLLERDGVLEKEQYFEICKQFGISQIKTYSAEYEYSWYGLKEYVNHDMINKLYGNVGK